MKNKKRIILMPLLISMIFFNTGSIFANTEAKVEPEEVGQAESISTPDEQLKTENIPADDVSISVSSETKAEPEETNQADLTSTPVEQLKTENISVDDVSISFSSEMKAEPEDTNQVESISTPDEPLMSEDITADDICISQSSDTNPLEVSPSLVTFDTKLIGYSQQTILVEIKNISNYKIILKSLASLNSSNYFEFSEHSNTEILPNKSTLIKVTPKLGLCPGIYREVFKIETENGITKNFKAEFEVTEVSGIEIGPKQISFGRKEESYKFIDSRTIYIKNIGDSPITLGDLYIHDSEASEAFILSEPTTKIIDSGQTIELSVTPKLDLSLGYYSGQVIIQSTNGLSGSVNIDFEVYKPKPEYYLTIESEYGGRITCGESGIYDPGETINISAEPDDNYEFLGWKTTSGHLSSEDSLETTFTMPSSKANTARFRLISTRGDESYSKPSPIPVETLNIKKPTKEPEAKVIKSIPLTGDSTGNMIFIYGLGGLISIISIGLLQTLRKKSNKEKE